MVRDITFGQYLPVNSVVHRMDARVKIVLIFAYIVFVFLCKNFFSMALAVVFALVSLAVSKIPFKTVLKSMKPVAIILIFTAVLNLFYTSGGETLFSWKFITITDKGIYTAVFMAIRIICLIAVSSILTYTTTPTALTDAIERLLSFLKLFKVPVHSLAMMMTLALRFIPTLIEEIDRITSAQKARGVDFESGGFKEKIKALLPILIPLFVSAFRRAYELAFAMECRCYTGGEGRTRMKQMKVRASDILISAVCTAMFAGIIVLNHFFGALV